MQKEARFYYLINFRYLGFRYHGWQKQLNVKTVQLMVEKTLSFIFPEKRFKVLASSRTDSMVSALDAVFKLTLFEDIEPEFIFHELNKNLPADIEVLSCDRSTKEFQIIGHAKLKTYHYFFSNEFKAHPFSAPFMVNFRNTLDINLMKEGAKLFEGHHCFKAYCFKGNENTIYDREVTECRIESNTIMSASFFPEKSYVLIVKGPGFMRNQIRIMMGTLFNLGQEQISLEQISDSLKPEYSGPPPGFIAPASGLILDSVKLADS